MTDQRGWPAHLRDDAPYVVCSACGRHSWAGVGGQCSMTQPDGTKCPGMFMQPIQEGDDQRGTVE